MGGWDFVDSSRVGSVHFFCRWQAEFWVSMAAKQQRHQNRHRTAPLARSARPPNPNRAAGAFALGPHQLLNELYAITQMS
jgi:hypothetical protein